MAGFGCFSRRWHSPSRPSVQETRVGSYLFSFFSHASDACGHCTASSAHREDGEENRRSSPKAKQSDGPSSLTRGRAVSTAVAAAPSIPRRLGFFRFRWMDLRSSLVEKERRTHRREKNGTQDDRTEHQGCVRRRRRNSCRYTVCRRSLGTTARTRGVRSSFRIPRKRFMRFRGSRRVERSTFGSRHGRVCGKSGLRLGTHVPRGRTKPFVRSRSVGDLWLLEHEEPANERFGCLCFQARSRASSPDRMVAVFRQTVERSVSFGSRIDENVREKCFVQKGFVARHPTHRLCSRKRNRVARCVVRSCLCERNRIERVQGWIVRGVSVAGFDRRRDDLPRHPASSSGPFATKMIHRFLVLLGKRR
mmetsp:Transcript_10516/g.64429  ORF Transcript_10516/g.64429 Transcript_10516/m.64429 type:complete len:363 (+) Transcript_10516:521-1609(+)